jgi:enamine deaminase RidA (YjgF/YER057c/UK114 family)|tara:strand:+ start:363 stop:587 length:225 start_codon:yes stop_codon:yes gene_type:complete|eukprot:31514-Pelagococcus_subviridis.AAC.2
MPFNSTPDAPFNSTPTLPRPSSEYTKQPAVVNGLANLFIDVFGPAGKSSRSAVGCAGLPLGIPVEAEAIVELKK